ncbi:fatty acid cis/trans isomerase, partial [Vibrio vulnificus]|uniref:fatty acid cis/trans isomerase n=1 Tax=Vibrio vulnificus TaxID=672 RepID=UPI0039B47584
RDNYADAPAPSWSTLWAGNDNALLSIFRHFDSASVTKGLIGEVPQTMWLFDFPLLERTYYQLAVNFDVFGNVSHQAQTRLYFDLIRNGAEQ